MDSTFARWDGRTPEAIGAQRRYYGRAAKSVAIRMGAMGAAIAILALATIAFGLIVGPIGWNGLFVVALLTLAIMIAISVWPSEPARVAYSDELPTGALVR